MRKESATALHGTTLEVYRFMLKRGRPIGVREIQRTLKLSSPSIAVYHLSKLEDRGFVKRESGNYIIDKVFLENSIRISSFLVPKYLFYATISICFLLIELTIFRPLNLTYDYIFFTITTAVLSYFSWYETAKVWLKGIL